MRNVSSAERRARTTWRSGAACQGIDTEIFFPARGESAQEALAICDSCSVQRDCAEHALELPERFGIWGGTSERGRRRVRSERRRPLRVGRALREETSLIPLDEPTEAELWAIEADMDLMEAESAVLEAEQALHSDPDPATAAAFVEALLDLVDLMELSGTSEAAA